MNEFFRQMGVQVDWTFVLKVGSLIMIRFAMVTAVLPFLVGKPVPGFIRMGVSIVMTIFLYPFLAPSDPAMVPTALPATILLYLKEAFYGLAIGLAGGMIFHAFEAAGSIVDNQRGAAQARLLIPQLGEQSSIFGNLNYQLGLVLFLVLGGHLLFIKAVVESYDQLPLWTFPATRIDFLAVSEEFISMSGSVLVTALQLTAPILISIFITDVVLGIMTKTAPQINVYELGFAVRGVMGVLIYFLSLGLIATQMGKISFSVLGSVDRIVKFLAHGGS